MIIGNRISRRLKSLDASQGQLARAIGVSPQAISKMVTGDTKDTSKLYQIARFLKTTPEYLTGETEESGMAETSLDYHVAFDLEPLGKQQAEDMGIALIPELQLGYSMGGGNVIEMFEHNGVAPFKREWLRPMMKGSFDELFVAKGEGDSMIPTMLDGDIVLIDTAQKDVLQQDRIWVLSYGDLGMIKRVRKLPDGGYQINSDNPAVTAITAYDGEMHVIGRVIWVGRRM